MANGNIHFPKENTTELIAPTTSTTASATVNLSQFDFVVFVASNNSGRAYGTTVIPASLISNAEITSVYVYAGNVNYYVAFSLLPSAVQLTTSVGSIYGSVYGVKIR